MWDETCDQLKGAWTHQREVQVRKCRLQSTVKILKIYHLSNGSHWPGRTDLMDDGGRPLTRHGQDSSLVRAGCGEADAQVGRESFKVAANHESDLLMLT